ncbi:MAG: HAMP domain-containing sensor histidine kinase [Gemmatimonadota bacterium]
MLGRVAESVRRVTGAEHTLVVHRLPLPSLVDVLAACGAGAPAVGTRIAAPEPHPPDRMVLPLSIDGVSLGAIVAHGVAHPLDDPAQHELALLSGLGTLALQNHLLILEAARRTARQAERHYRLLAGTIYHLKNAIAVGAEYIELIDLEGELNDTQRDYVTRSRRSVATALRLLSELHELGRADAGQLVPKPEPLNVDSLIRDAVRDHRLSAGTSGVTFDYLAHPLPLLRTDPDCVRQILDNLLSNAIRYSPADGHVTVQAAVREGRRARDPERWLRIDVADMGPGVLEREGVFEEVERVERKGAPGFRLAISRRVARLLGGDLTLETDGAAGSTFSLWLPLEDVDDHV